MTQRPSGEKEWEGLPRVNYGESPSYRLMVWNGPATDSIRVLKRGRCEQRHKVGSRSVKQISTIGLDLAKNVFLNSWSRRRGRADL